MIIEIYLAVILGILNLFLFSLFINIFLKYKIYDVPDFSRKIHETKVPLVGGIVFLINFFIYLPFILIFDESLIFFNGLREILGFFIGIVLIFLIGFYDDRFFLKPNSKLVLIALVAIITLSISDIYKVDHFNFLFLEKKIFLENFGIIFTIFCILVFVNAFNMIDGINGLSVSYFLICIFYILSLNFNLSFFIFLIIPGIIFLYFNFKNKLFLGDSGSLLLGFTLSCLFIKSHNDELINADQIVLLMIIPGIDMLRVASLRILKKKHAFQADRSHLHHLLLKKYNYLTSYLIIVGLIALTAFISIIVKSIYINVFEIISLVSIYLIFFGLIKLQK